MEKVLNISGKECVFKTSAALPRLYRIKFRRDIYNDFRFIEKEVKKHKEDGQYLPPEALTTFENLGYMMHKHGDPSQPNNVNDWLDQFETFDIYEVFPEIISLWNGETETTVEPKKEDQE